MVLAVNKKAICVVISLVMAAKNVYQAGGEFPRLHSFFAFLWGVWAGSYLTELAIQIEMGIEL